MAGLCRIHLVRVSSCAASGLRRAIRERCWSFPRAGCGQLASARSGSGNGRGLTARSRSMPTAVSKSTCCNRRGRSPFHSRPARLGRSTTASASVTASSSSWTSGNRRSSSSSSSAGQTSRPRSGKWALPVQRKSPSSKRSPRQAITECCELTSTLSWRLVAAKPGRWPDMGGLVLAYNDAQRRRLMRIVDAYFSRSVTQ